MVSSRLAALFLATLFAAAPALGWTPKTQQVLAREAALLAPPDLARQIERHHGAFMRGAVAPFDDTDAAFHVKNPDGSGLLDKVIATEIERTVQAIRSHQPFEEIVYQIGVVSHYVADANNPLNTSAADSGEGRYFGDFLRYLESAEPRLRLIFYGRIKDFETLDDLGPWARHSLARSRTLYPSIGREYERIHFASGVQEFDDRSTAFGIANLAFNHAFSDIVLALRYIWIRAGGGDRDGRLPLEGESLALLPRAGR